jgi:hypothetical protein
VRASDKLYKVQFTAGKRAGQVGRLPWRKASNLHDRGEANFISNTLFKAVKAGLDLNLIKDPRDDRAIKKQIAKIVEDQKKKQEKQEKPEKKREQKKRGKDKKEKGKDGRRRH